MNAATHDIIALQDLRVTCLVGIHPHERITPQPLVVQLKLYFERKPDISGGRWRRAWITVLCAGTWRFCWKRAIPVAGNSGGSHLCHLAHDTAAGPPEHSPGRCGGEHPKAPGPRRQGCTCGTVLRHAEEMQYGIEHNDFGTWTSCTKTKTAGCTCCTSRPVVKSRPTSTKSWGRPNWSCRVGCCSKASLLTAALPTCGRSSSCTSTTTPLIPPARSCASTVRNSIRRMRSLCPS